MAKAGNLRVFNPVHLFFPAKANIQFKRTRVKTYKTKSTPCPKSIYNPTLSLTLKPTPSLTQPLTLKHYPRKNTLKQKTRIEIPDVTSVSTLKRFSHRTMVTRGSLCYYYNTIICLLSSKWWWCFAEAQLEGLTKIAWDQLHAVFPVFMAFALKSAPWERSYNIIHWANNELFWNV